MHTVVQHVYLLILLYTVDRGIIIHVLLCTYIIVQVHYNVLNHFLFYKKKNKNKIKN